MRDSSPPATGTLHTTDNSVFEGLFARLLKPEGAFAAELKEVGYDIRRPEIRYPSEVWRQCVLVACKHVHPTLSEEEALYALGTRFPDGYFATIVGKIIVAGAPFLGVRRMIKRLPIYYASTRAGVRIDIEEDVEGRVRLLFHDPYMLMGFAIGMIESSLRRVQASVAVTEYARSAEGGGIEVTW